MKIAIFHNLPSGGGKRAMFEMTRRLAARHELDVYAFSSANHDFCDLRPYARQYHIFDFKPSVLFRSPCGILNHGVRAIDVFRARVVQRAVAETINEGGYDVALVHSDQYTQSPAVLKHLRIPSVYYCHDILRSVYDPPISRPYLQLSGLPYWANRFNLLRHWYVATVTREDRAGLRAATIVLVNSLFSAETLYRIHAVRSYVCYLGIDTTRFRPEAGQRGNYAVSVGAIAPPKGFDFLIDSLALVPASLRPPLIIVGNYANDAERKYLQDRAQAKRVTVEFRLLISDAELAHLYNHARCTLYAPVLEPFGFVPLESMACGTPVIAVAEGGVRESVRHNETGLLVERDPQQFAQAITVVLSQSQYAAELGQRGPAYVQEQWNWDRSVARLEEHLAAAAHHKRSAHAIAQAQP